MAQAGLSREEIAVRKIGAASVVAVLLLSLTGTVARAQDGPTTFFNREEWDSCAGLLAAADTEAAAGPVRGAEWQPRTAAFAAYFAFAEGYLTARAEGGHMQRTAYRPSWAAPAMRFLGQFCAGHHAQTFYAAVMALDLAIAAKPPNLTGPDRGE